VPTRPGVAVTVGTVLTLLVGAVLFGVGLLIIAAVVLAVLAVSLCAAVVTGVAHALRTHPGARAGTRRFGRPESPPAVVIDTTARVTRETHHSTPRA
jgi:hypothetical protein